MKRRTNFDLYLDEQLKDPGLADLLKKAGEAWEAALRPALGRKRPRFRKVDPHRGRTGPSRLRLTRPR
jgi:hypothetical protein